LTETHLVALVPATLGGVSRVLFIHAGLEQYLL
jgi:hypothetical protein